MDINGKCFLEGYYDNIDLINVILTQIDNQREITEEDRRVMTHLQESLYQLNLKRQREENYYD